MQADQGCNNMLEKMAGMKEDAKNSAMKMHEVKLTAENSYKEADTSSMDAASSSDVALTLDALIFEDSASFCTR